MEDSHSAVLNLDEGKPDDESNTFFAVYDGHGGAPFLFFFRPIIEPVAALGSSVARFAGQNVYKRLVTEETYKAKEYEKALKRAFLGTDEDLLASTLPWFSNHFSSLLNYHSDPSSSRDPSGCTAVAALITADNKIYVVSYTSMLFTSGTHYAKANAGDSRSVIGIKGEVKALSFDHKPTSESRYISLVSNAAIKPTM